MLSIEKKNIRQTVILDPVLFVAVSPVPKESLDHMTK